MDKDLIIAGAVIFILLLLSAFFSGAETALTAASKARLHSLEKEGNKRAALVNKIRAKKDKMLGALLLGNTLVNIFAASIATSVLIRMFGPAEGVLYATLAMTIIILTFSEVLPKTYALLFADKVSLRVAPLVKAFTFIFAPVTVVISAVVRGLLRIAGVNTSMVSGSSHFEILKGVIDMHTGPEEEVQEQRAMLRSILDLNEVEVHEVMTHRKDVMMVDASRTTDQTVEEILDSAYSRIPLWKEDPDNIIGVLHVKTLLRDMQGNDGKISETDIKALCAEPWFIPESTTLADQLKAFRERHEHFAIVVDEYGSFMGVVTLEDIIEEIVGEIEDEEDEIVAGVRKQPNGSYMVDGDVTIRDLNREFDWNLPDEDYATVAGLILNEARVLPESGQSFNFYGFRFDVIRRQRNQITLVRMTPPKKQAGEAA